MYNLLLRNVCVQLSIWSMMNVAAISKSLPIALMNNTIRCVTILHIIVIECGHKTAARCKPHLIVDRGRRVVWCTLC